MSRVILKKISIIQLDADCIVNAANSELKAGGGVCGQIFEAAGYDELTGACRRIGGCKSGGAVITPAFNMKQKYIIHAVGPIWTGGNNGEAFQLKSAYRSALDLAVENNCRSIGFPLISAGIYGYPKAEAWKVALEAVFDFFKAIHEKGIDIDVFFTSLDDEVLWMGKDEADRQQALYDAWLERLNFTPSFYDEEGDTVGIFENRTEPVNIMRYSDNPYLDPELLFADIDTKPKTSITVNSDEIILFWNNNEENGYLSQWYRAPMTIDGVDYSSCEQYMMAKKALAMGDVEHYILIMHESDPSKVKKLGREVRNFDSEKWNSVVHDIIFDGNLAKFSQNDDLKSQLLETGEALLAEASPTDLKYGIGFRAEDPEAKVPEKWKGDNLMGETLMKVRETLKA